jgi:transcriptional regulator with XRE-family HTH domain
MTLSEKLKQIRTYKNLTQEDVAEKLKISTQAYSKIERGETKLDTNRLEQIAQILEISLEDLLKNDEKGLLFQFNDYNKDNTVNHYTASEKIIAVLEKTIHRQNEEIAFLRQQIQQLNQIILNK